jgi:hypothetical protein
LVIAIGAVLFVIIETEKQVRLALRRGFNRQPTQQT